MLTWQEVCEIPYLQDLPFKTELNERGQIIMTPASNRHGFYQMKMGILLSSFIADGEIISECSINTAKGVKVADIAWISSDFLKNFEYKTPYDNAPELCIEVLSPTNSKGEIKEKMALYFDGGAVEVWLCHGTGELTFHAATGQIKQSALVPNFPSHLFGHE